MDLPEAQHFASVVIVQRTVKGDDHSAKLELLFHEARHAIELKEAEIELNVYDLGVRESEGLLEFGQVGIPPVAPRSNDAGFSKGVDQFCSDVRVDVEIDESTRVTDDVPGILRDSASGIPRGDHCDLL